MADEKNTTTASDSEASRKRRRAVCLLATVAVLALGESAIAETTPPAPVHASMQEQDACAARAKKAADKWMSDNYNDRLGSSDNFSGDTVESHMNAKLGECLVLIMGRVYYKLDYRVKYNPPDRIDPHIGILFDAIGGRQFGYYYWDNPTEQVAPYPKNCSVEGVIWSADKPCFVQDDWYAATRKYMVD
jgi:hypothetical protein